MNNEKDFSSYVDLTIEQACRHIESFTEVKDARKFIVKYVLARFRGDYANKVTNEIISVYREGVEETVSGKILSKSGQDGWKTLFKSLLQLPHIVENGKPLGSPRPDRHGHRGNNKADNVQNFETPIVVDGKNLTANFLVKRYLARKDNNFHYLSVIEEMELV